MSVCSLSQLTNAVDLAFTFAKFLMTKAILHIGEPKVHILISLLPADTEIGFQLSTIPVDRNPIFSHQLIPKEKIV